MENDSEARQFRRQLACVLFGALIGFIPAGILAAYQASQQRAQFLLDRRMSALRDFASAVNGSGELISAVSELEVAIQHLEHREPKARTQADWGRVDSLYKLVIDRRYKWAADVNAQATIIQALFPPNTEPPECRPSQVSHGAPLSFANFAGAQRPLQELTANQDQRIAYMKSNVGAFKRELVEAIDNTQKTINCHAAHLF